MRNKIVGARLTEEEFEHFKNLATHAKMSVSGYAAKLIRDGLLQQSSQTEDMLEMITYQSSQISQLKKLSMAALSAATAAEARQMVTKSESESREDFYRRFNATVENLVTIAIEHAEKLDSRLDLITGKTDRELNQV